MVISGYKKTGGAGVLWKVVLSFDEPVDVEGITVLHGAGFQFLRTPPGDYCAAFDHITKRPRNRDDFCICVGVNVNLNRKAVYIRSLLQVVLWITVNVLPDRIGIDNFIKMLAEGVQPYGRFSQQGANLLAGCTNFKNRRYHALVPFFTACLIARSIAFSISSAKTLMTGPSIPFIAGRMIGRAAACSVPNSSIRQYQVSPPGFPLSPAVL
nr:MAG TPA: hypothetical protein [Caudoviricetes sp.]